MTCSYPHHGFQILSICLILLIAASNILSLDPYKTLGVSPNADIKTIKRAYRKLSVKWHPDKNPKSTESSRKKFLEIVEAWQILSNEETREIFDKYGEEAVKKHLSGGNVQTDPFDIFRQFFGGGGGGNGGNSNENSNKKIKKKSQTLLTEIEVDLEDIYVGRSIEFEIQRSVVCPKCKGNGARKVSDITECKTCDGQGIRIIRHQLGPGIFQQMQIHCDQCGGQGKKITHKCTECHGHKTIEEINRLTLDIDRGSPDGHEELFESEGNEAPGIDAGDVILRIRIKKQSNGGFRRLGDNLYSKEVLSLDEALLGFTRSISHLDGHDLKISRTAVTQPGFVQVIEGEGMPRHQALGYGNLFIEFSVVLPIEVSGSFRSNLEKLFEPYRSQDHLTSQHQPDQASNHPEL